MVARSEENSGQSTAHFFSLKDECVIFVRIVESLRRIETEEERDSYA